MKQDAPYHILRVGTAITFLWIGVLILREPEFWGGFLSPWAADLLPVPLTQAMLGTAVLDIVIGFLLLIDVFVWVAALLASIHLGIVLATTGINAVTVRDIGLLAGTIALFWGGLPRDIRLRIKHWRHKQPPSAPPPAS